MLEAGIGQAEVVETVVERRAGDGDGEIAHLGEVGQTHAPRFVDLAKDDLLVRAMDGAPGADPTLQGPAHARAELGIAPQNLLEMATGRSPGAASRIGTISLCQTSASGSGRRRSRRTFLCEEAQVLLDSVGA